MARAGSFVFRLSAQGVEELRRELAGLGSAGEAAFKKIADASPALADAFGRADRAAAGASKSLSGSLGGIGAAFRSAAGEVESAAQNMTGAIGGLGRVLSSFGPQGLALAASVGGAASLFFSSASAVDQYRTALAKLDVAAGSLDIAKVSYNELFRQAQQTGTAVGDLAQSFTRLVPATRQLGLTNAEALKLNDTIVKLARASGADAQEFGAGFRQLTQGLASGRLQGDELRSTLENIPPVAKAIADGLGVPVSKLREMAAAGELTAERVVAALQKQAAAADEAFARLGNNSERERQRAVNEWSEAIRAIGEVLRSNEAITALLSFGGSVARGAREALAPDLSQNLAKLKRIQTELAGNAPGSFLAPASSSDVDKTRADIARQIAAARDQEAAIEADRHRAAEAKLENQARINKSFDEYLAKLRAAAALEAQPAREQAYAKAEASALRDAKDLGPLSPEQSDKIKAAARGIVDAEEAAKSAKKFAEDNAKFFAEVGQTLARHGEAQAKAAGDIDKTVAALEAEAAAHEGGVISLENYRRAQAIARAEDEARQKVLKAFPGDLGRAEEAARRAAEATGRLYDAKRANEQAKLIEETDRATAAVEAEAAALFAGGEAFRQFGRQAAVAAASNQTFQKLAKELPEDMERVREAAARAGEAAGKLFDAKGVAVDRDKLERELERASERQSELLFEPVKNAIADTQRATTDLFENIQDKGRLTFASLADEFARVGRRFVANYASLLLFNPDTLRQAGVGSPGVRRTTFAGPGARPAFGGGVSSGGDGFDFLNSIFGGGGSVGGEQFVGPYANPAEAVRVAGPGFGFSSALGAAGLGFGVGSAVAGAASSFIKNRKTSRLVGVAGGALSGAAAGAAVGGPYGAVIGGIAGAVGGFLSKKKKPKPPKVPYGYSRIVVGADGRASLAETIDKGGAKGDATRRPAAGLADDFNRFAREQDIDLVSGVDVRLVQGDPAAFNKRSKKKKKKKGGGAAAVEGPRTIEEAIADFIARGGFTDNEDGRVATAIRQSGARSFEELGKAINYSRNFEGNLAGLKSGQEIGASASVRAADETRARVAQLRAFVDDAARLGQGYAEAHAAARQYLQVLTGLADATPKSEAVQQFEAIAARINAAGSALNEFGIGAHRAGELIANAQRKFRDEYNKAARLELLDLTDPIAAEEQRIREDRERRLQEVIAIGGDRVTVEAIYNERLRKLHEQRNADALSAAEEQSQKLRALFDLRAELLYTDAGGKTKSEQAFEARQRYNAVRQQFEAGQVSGDEFASVARTALSTTRAVAGTGQSFGALRDEVFEIINRAALTNPAAASALGGSLGVSSSGAGGSAQAQTPAAVPVAAAAPVGVNLSIPGFDELLRAVRDLAGLVRVSAENGLAAAQADTDRVVGAVDGLAATFDRFIEEQNRAAVYARRQVG